MCIRDSTNIIWLFRIIIIQSINIIPWCSLSYHTRWVVIHHWIISAVCIQVQSIPSIYIFLQEPSYNWIIVPCPQIILPTDSVILLSCIKNPVLDPFLAFSDYSKHIILIYIFNLSTCSKDISCTVLLIQMIGVISLPSLIPAGRYSIS